MPAQTIYKDDSNFPPSVVREQDIETGFVEKLRNLKYTDRPDIRDRAALEQNFREKFETLNRVKLTESDRSDRGE
jgi:type I restriction enzyme R subunit